MRTGTVTAHVRINAGIFRRFALFDAFRLKRRWVSPAVFCAVFLALSFLCMASGREQSGLIGTLLQVIGLGLPACYVLSFLVQVHDQCRRLGLKTLRPAYTLNLGETELRVTQIGKECHNDCAIKRTAGKCVMPTDGIFTVVEAPGIIKPGDKIEII